MRMQSKAFGNEEDINGHRGATAVQQRGGSHLGMVEREDGENMGHGIRMIFMGSSAEKWNTSIHREYGG